MCAVHRRPLPGADEPVTDEGLAELESLVDRVGWSAARGLLAAVSGVGRREHLAGVSQRELATLRIALAVLAESAG